MSEFDRVNWHNSAMTKEALPLLIGILVVDSVLYIVGKQVLQLDRRVKPQTYFGRLPPDHRSIVSLHTETGRVLTEG